MDYKHSSEFWKKFRKKKLNQLNVALNEGKVDYWILPIINVINAHPAYVTLSSCAGRLVVMDMPDFGNKKESIFLGKWHEIPDVLEVLNAIKAGKKTTWIMLHPPILHVSCFSIKYADKLMKVANNSGIRRAGLISLKRLVVEICTQERIEIPVKVGGVDLLEFDLGNLQKILEISRKKLERSRRKFEKFRFEFLKLI